MFLISYHIIMIDQLPDDIQNMILSNINASKKRLLNTTIRLPKSSYIDILKTTHIAGKRVVLSIMLRNNIRKLFATLDKYIPSYAHSLCNYSSMYLPYKDQCLVFAPKNQGDPYCRFCGKYKIDHRYWKMINIYFQSRHIF